MGTGVTCSDLFCCYPLRLRIIKLYELIQFSQNKMHLERVDLMVRNWAEVPVEKGAGKIF